MVSHNAETNRVPRRIYVYASERSGVHAYRLVSIYIPGPGSPVHQPRRDRPHCLFDEHCAPAACLRNDRHLLSLTSLILLIRLCFSVIFSFRIDRSKENARRRGTVKWRISGLANLVTKWLLRVSLVTRSVWFDKFIRLYDENYSIPLIRCGPNSWTELAIANRSLVNHINFADRNKVSIL